MAAPSSGKDFPTVSPAKFYGSSLPRPYLYNDARFGKERIDPPEAVVDPFLSWAREAHWSMGGLNLERRRMQGRIEGSIKKLREQEEEEEEKEKNGKRRKRCDNRTIQKEEKRDKQRNRSNNITIDSEESEVTDPSESEETDVSESEGIDPSESEETDASESKETDVSESEETGDGDRSEEENKAEEKKEAIKGIPSVGCRRSKRLKKLADHSEEE